MEHIRNFSIIAHIDHGKSTLADRMLEHTKTVSAREMRDQVLDQMELERERGITIKMQPVRMEYTYDETPYVFNLIDTPGHIDFAYEVSRALKAVEGVLLLVDSTQGVQAQTLSTLAMAREQGCIIIPVLSKVDSPYARIDDVTAEIMELLDCDPDDVIHTSGKTGAGVDTLLKEIVKKIPAPTTEDNEPKALVFDFAYSTHRGIALYVRMFNGTLKKGDQLKLAVAKTNFNAQSLGVLTPGEKEKSMLQPGEIGYVVTGIKEPGIVSVGDTVILQNSSTKALAGYREPAPVVWASVYPESQDDLTLLRQSLERLRLTDSSLSFEEEASGVLGRGFRCGFLGMLHLEIITERLKREFDLSLIVTMPTITYEVVRKNGERETIYTPARFPEYGDTTQVEEPWIEATLITTAETTSNILKLLTEHEAVMGDTRTFGDGRVEFKAEMPLRELMRGFFDRLKSVSSGYASLSYEFLEQRPADVVRLDVLVAEEVVPAFTRIVSRRRAQEEGEKLVDKLHDILPRQLFVTKIQAQAMGRILSSKTLSALKKDVTGHLYGGDITRKRKLWEKQKKGKKKLKERGKVDIPEEVFMKMIKNDS